MNIVVSVNVGLPKDVEWRGTVVRTAIWKQPVQGRVLATRLNLSGDGQADLSGHGGEQRAVMVYQLGSYRYWETYLRRSDFVCGNFGENLTVEGLADDEVCIGDRFRIGGGIFEVSQPHVTCYRVGIRLNHPEMAALLVSHRRPGFYFRVIQEGEVGAGDRIEKIAGGPEQMTVAEINALLYSGQHRIESLQRALRIPALSLGWRGSMRALLEAAERGEQVGNAGLSSTLVAPLFWRGFRSLKVVSSSVSTSDRSNSRPSMDHPCLPRFRGNTSSSEYGRAWTRRPLFEIIRSAARPPPGPIRLPSRMRVDPEAASCMSASAREPSWRLARQEDHSRLHLA